MKFIKRILSDRIQAIQKLSRDDPFACPSAGHYDLSAQLLVPKPRLSRSQAPAWECTCKEAPASRKTTRSRGFGRRSVPKPGLGNEKKKFSLTLPEKPCHNFHETRGLNRQRESEEYFYADECPQIFFTGNFFWP
jgi:hypothetical protein